MHVLAPGARIQANTVPLFFSYRKVYFGLMVLKVQSPRIEWASLVQPLVMVFLLADSCWQSSGVSQNVTWQVRGSTCVCSIRFQFCSCLQRLCSRLHHCTFGKIFFCYLLWKIEHCFLQLEGYQCFMIICMVIIVLHDNQLQSHFSLLGSLNYSQCPPGLEESWRSGTKYCPCRSELRKGGCL